MSETRTRAENAAIINAALGTEIDTKAGSKPNAPVLQDWAERVGADPAGVQRDVLAFLVEEALRTELDPAVGTERLAGWLARIHLGERDAVLAEVQAAKGQDTPPESPAPVAAQEGEQAPAPAPAPEQAPQGQEEAEQRPEQGQEQLPASPVMTTPAQPEAATPGAPAGQAAEQDGATSAEQPTVPADTLRVTVNAVIVGYSGTFSDPEQEAGANVIGAEPVEVRLTETVRWGLATGTLVRAG